MRNAVILFIGMIISGVLLMNGCGGEADSITRSKWSGVVNKKMLHAKSNDILNGVRGLSNIERSQLRRNSNKMAFYMVEYDLESRAKDEQAKIVDTKSKNYIKRILSFDNNNTNYAFIYCILSDKNKSAYNEIVFDSKQSPYSKAVIDKFNEYNLKDIIVKESERSIPRRSNLAQDIFLFWLLGPRYSYMPGYYSGYWGSGARYPRYSVPRRYSYHSSYRSRRTGSGYRGGGSGWGK